jgi:cysteine desulfurase
MPEREKIMEAYLDNQSNTKVSERVLKAMLPYYQKYYGNAQSMYSLGAKSKDAIEKARGQVAGLIGAKENEVYFTSCGSESNNLALKGVYEAHKSKGKPLRKKAGAGRL